jgi:hypothetical protein
MTSEDFLHRLRDASDPSPGARERVHARMRSGIEDAPLFARVRAALQPDPRTASSVWLRVQRSLGSPSPVTLLQRLQGLLRPSESARVLLRERVMAQLRPRTIVVGAELWKWAAATAAVALMIRWSPMLITNTSLTPRTSAQAEVTVMPEGEVSLLQAELWQPIDPETGLTMRQPGTIRTDDGQATVLLPNYGVVRMDSNTVLQILDTSADPQPAEGSTVKLLAGRIWVLGFLPEYLRGITVGVRGDTDVEVHEGSVSIAVADDGKMVDVSVWNRGASVSRGEGRVALVAGENVQVKDRSPLVVRRSDVADADNAWNAQNLAQDSLRRKEVAQSQLEWRAAQAGILPTSPLYVVKRVAEAVDRALTFSEEGRLEKQIVQAETRLNEAAALLSEGSEAATALEEYKETLLAVASNSGSHLIRSLLEQELVESTADVAAALPDDESYALKETVLRVSAQLPFVDKRRVEGVLVMDTLSALDQAIEEGDLDTVTSALGELQPYLSSLKHDERILPSDVRREAISSLEAISTRVMAQAGEVDVPADLVAYVEPFIPAPIVPALTAEQEDQRVQIIRRHLQKFDSVRALENTIIYELDQLQALQDAGKISFDNHLNILRRLYALLEDGQSALDDAERGRVSEFVRQDIEEVRRL